MNNFNFLYSFGCSFTKGSGLDTLDFRRYMDNDATKNYSQEDLNLFANYHSYPGYLSRLLGCDFQNLGVGSASNECILRNVYNTFKNLDYCKENTLITIQTSILSRITVYEKDYDRYTNLNGLTCIDPLYKAYYTEYVTKFYDDKHEFDKLLQNIELFNVWLNTKNLNVIWILYDTGASTVPKDKYFLQTDGKNLGDFAAKNKLLLTNLPNFPTEDRHFSLHGNEIIAKYIYEYLKTYGN